MSAFNGATHIDGNTIDANELTNIHEALCARPDSSFGGLVSANSTAWVDANGKTLDVAADDYFIWTVNFVYSVETAGAVGGVRFLANNVTIGVPYPLREYGLMADNGIVTPVSFTVHVTDVPAGTRDFKFQLQKSSGSNSIFIGNSYAWFARFKRGA